MAKTIVDGSVIINNKPVAIMCNTIERKKGRGETSVRTQSLGGGNVETVHSVNLESAKSSFKFDLSPTLEHIDLVDAMKLNTGLNVISYVAEGVTETYEEVSIINDPVIPDSNDGVIAVECEGKPLPR